MWANESTHDGQKVELLHFSMAPRVLPSHTDCAAITVTEHLEKALHLHELIIFNNNNNYYYYRELIIG